MTNFNLHLDFSDPASHDADELAGIIQTAIINALDANGIAPPFVTVTEVDVPKVLITVSGGVAEIVAASTPIDAVLIDYDNAEDDGFDVDAELQPSRIVGTASAYDEALAKERYSLDVVPRP